MEMVSIKISKTLQKKIKKYVKSTGQTISGYANIRLSECLQQDEKEKRTFDEVDKLAKQL
jgi:hypothetical protein